MSAEPLETPIPIALGGERLWAVLHRPNSRDSRGEGVLLCPAFADEAFRTHRELVVCARRLAAGGFATLRFDYRGTGDSEGDFAAFTLDDWCDDIDAAVDALRSAAGVGRVALLGLRLGAALAAIAAARNPHVSRAVLWAPLRPARCLAEIDKALRTRQLLLHGKVADRTSLAERLQRGDPVEFMGYPLTPALHAQLEHLDPWSAPARLPEQALVVAVAGARGDAADAEHAAKAYRDASVRRIDERRFWFDKVYQAPDTLFATTLEWLAAAPAASHAATAARSRPTATPDANEQPFQCISDGLRLHGVVHVPAGRSRGGVVVFHGGRQARRGPHRLYVKLARRLAAAGFHVLRYDNRGYGDSEGTEQRVFDDWLEDAVCATEAFRQRYAPAALWGWGLCAGALLGAHASRRLPDGFDGLVLCNALLRRAAAPPPRTEPRWRRGAAAPVRLGRRALRRLLARPRDGRDQGFATRFDRRMAQPLAEFPELVAGFAGPKLMVFGDADPFVDGFRERFAQRNGADDSLDLVTIPGGDHNFANLEHEARVIQTSAEWLARQATRSARPALPSGGGSR